MARIRRLPDLEARREEHQAGQVALATKTPASSWNGRHCNPAICCASRRKRRAKVQRFSKLRFGPFGPEITGHTALSILRGRNIYILDFLGAQRHFAQRREMLSAKRCKRLQPRCFLRVMWFRSLRRMR